MWTLTILSIHAVSPEPNNHSRRKILRFGMRPERRGVQGDRIPAQGSGKDKSWRRRRQRRFSRRPVSPRRAPRPLADRLRPERLADVVGQDHLLGPNGAHHPHARLGFPRLVGLLGAAGNREDHGGASPRRRHRPRIRPDLGSLLRRRRSQEGVRRRAQPARGRQGDAALRRRDPSLQPRPAGFLPAGDGGRHGDAGRRHHREPVLRAQRRASVAGPRPGLPAARCRGDGEAPRPRRGGGGAEAAP